MDELAETMAAVRSDRVLAPAIVLLAAGFGASYGTGLALGELTRHTRKRDISRFDRGVSRHTRDLSNPVLDQAMALATALGEPWVLYPVTGGAAVAFASRGRGKDAVVSGLTVIGSAVLTEALKSRVHRPRPPVFLRHQKTSGSSFPSNHITMALATYSILAHLLTRRNGPCPQEEEVGEKERPQAPKRLTWTAALLISALIGWSRVYEDVHHPSDVFGGWVSSTLWIGACAGIRRLMD